MTTPKLISILTATLLLCSSGCQRKTPPKEDDPSKHPSKDPSGKNSQDSDGVTPKDPTKDPTEELPGDQSTGSDTDSSGSQKVLYTYIWIANSAEGTISKINTRTMVEEGRYQTRPDRLGSPSRTSVGITGNVVVANRGGGVTKFYADKKDCVDKNGDGTIQTSTGADNVLAWEEDECMAWHNPMTYGSQRVAAWTYEQSKPGPDGGKKTVKERVWITGIHEADPRIHVHLLDGDSGEILNSAEVSEVPGAFPYGAYGGAVDGNNDLWFSNGHATVGKLVRVSYKDLAVKVWDRPVQSYGITVDPKGRPWVCGVGIARFEPKSESWEAVKLPLGRQSSIGGCMVDGKNRLWLDVSDNAAPTVTGIDIETMKIVKTIKLPEHPHGISIDFDGNVWGVGISTNAFRVNPDSEKIDVYDKLTGAYTYSDMTGFALDSVQEDPPV